MRKDADDFGSDLIDVNGVSLQDLEGLPDSSLALALREVMTSGDVGPYASFSAQVPERPNQD
jgi:FXSXX-COOH protein